jgi:alpha-L-rhamnosidase
MSPNHLRPSDHPIDRRISVALTFFRFTVRRFLLSRIGCGGRFVLVSLLAVRLPAAGGDVAANATDIVGAEYKINPVGIDVAQPRLTWRLRSDQRGTVQTAYQVQVAATSDALPAGRDLIWDSGRVDSDRSVQVAYAGPTLKSGQRYHWRVRTWNGAGRVSAWSQPAYWEMGLLQPADWSAAAWITPAWEEDTTKSNPAPMLRKTFGVDGAVRAARLYVTSLGLYEAELNGRRVGDASPRRGARQGRQLLHGQSPRRAPKG